MACIPIPRVTPPELPSPLTIDPPASPAFTGNADLCCKLVQFDIPAPPLPLGPLVISDPVVKAALDAAFAAVNTFIDGLEFDCPKEPLASIKPSA